MTIVFNQKILCLGSNKEITHHAVTDLANLSNSVNRGIIVDHNYDPIDFGFYHTTILDLPAGEILLLSKKFDKIIMLDQGREDWDHWKPLLSTYKLMQELERLGHDTQYRDNDNIKGFSTLHFLVTENESFCIYPWINFVEIDKKIHPCNRSKTVVTTADKIVNWQTDENFLKIRTAMLEGTKMPDMCNTCYKYEEKGVESYRQFETREWLAKLNINTIDDLMAIDRPYYYELRLSNKCNLMCRGCIPAYSHLIEQESKTFNITPLSSAKLNYSSTDIIDIAALTPKTRVYLSGGDPTVISQVIEFMQKCIDAKKTDFDFTLGINAAKLSAKFIDLCSHFTNMNFSVSIDGYGRINDYWRWGSDFDTVIQNTKILQSQGHTISINCVPGIYNVTNLHLLYEFLDRELPNCGIYLQMNFFGHQSAWNHPNSELVVESMQKCQQTQTYHTDGKSNKTMIDSLLAHYSSKPKFNQYLLRRFFEYNDQLDQARGSRLGDYIPELEECRKYI